MEIAFEEISKRFGATLALDKVSAGFDGSVCMLLGPNGSGKTTLIACLNGLTFPDGGSICVDGRKYDAASRGQWRQATGVVRRRSGFSGDKPGLPGTFSVRELLLWSSRAGSNKVDDSWFAHIVEKLDMKSYVDKGLADCSSGMLQKAAIASSLMSEPEVVFWDEPTSNMDARGRLQVAGLVKELSATGTMFVIASHIPAEFEGLVDWVGVMAAGRFAAAGKASDLGRESNEYEASTNDPKGLGARIIQQGIGNDVRVVEGRVRFAAASAREESLVSPEALSMTSGCNVTGLWRIPVSVQRLYVGSLDEGKDHGQVH